MNSWQEVYSLAILAVGLGLYPIGFFLVGGCSTCCCSFAEYLRCIRFERKQPTPTGNIDDGRLACPEGRSIATEVVGDTGVAWVWTNFSIDQDSFIRIDEKSKYLSDNESVDITFTVNFFGVTYDDLILTIVGQDVPFLGPLEITKASFTGGSLTVDSSGVVTPIYNEDGLLVARLATENASRLINYSAGRSFEVVDAWCSSGNTFADGDTYTRSYLMSLISLADGPQNQEESLWLYLQQPPDEFRRYLSSSKFGGDYGTEATVINFLIRWSRGSKASYFVVPIFIEGLNYRLFGLPTVQQNQIVGENQATISGLFPPSAGRRLADGYTFEVFDVVPTSGGQFLDGRYATKAALKSLLTPEAQQNYNYFYMRWGGSGGLFDYVPVGERALLTYTLRVKQPWETTWCYFDVRLEVEGDGQTFPLSGTNIPYPQEQRVDASDSPFDTPMVFEQIAEAVDTPYEPIAPEYQGEYAFSVGSAWTDIIRFPYFEKDVTDRATLNSLRSYTSDTYSGILFTLSRNPVTFNLPYGGTDDLVLSASLTARLRNKQPILPVCAYSDIADFCSRPNYDHAAISRWLFENGQTLDIYFATSSESQFNPEVISNEGDEIWESVVSPPKVFCGEKICQANLTSINAGTGGQLYGGDEKTFLGSPLYPLNGPGGLGYVLAGIPRTVRYVADPLEEEVTFNSEKGGSTVVTNPCAGSELPISVTLYQRGCGWSGFHMTCDDIWTGCYLATMLEDDPDVCNSSLAWTPNWSIRSKAPSVGVHDFYAGDLLWVYENGPCRTSFQRDGGTYELGAYGESPSSNHCYIGGRISEYGFALANSASGCWVGEGVLTVPASVLADNPPPEDPFLSCYTYGSHLVAGDYVSPPSTLTCGTAYYSFEVDVVNLDPNFGGGSRKAYYTVFDRIATWCDPTIVYRSITGTTWLRTGDCEEEENPFVANQILINTVEPSLNAYYPQMPGWSFSVNSEVEVGLGNVTSKTPESIEASQSLVPLLDVRWTHPGIACRIANIPISPATLDVAWHIYPQLWIDPEDYDYTDAGDISALISLATPAYLERDGSGYCEIFNPGTQYWDAVLVDPRLGGVTNISGNSSGTTVQVPRGACRAVLFSVTDADANKPCSLSYYVLPAEQQLLTVRRLNAQTFLIRTLDPDDSPDGDVEIRFFAPGSSDVFTLVISVYAP